MLWRRRIALMVVMSSLVVVAGCAHWFGTAADALVPVEEERKLGAELEEELEEELEFSDDEELVRYVRGLGNDIVGVVDERPERIHIRFHVVDDDEMINAFAIPGGGIYVYTGLLKAMDNEAELTAVLAHEIAHVTRRHIAQRLVAAYGADLVSQMALGQEPGMVRQLVSAVAQQGFMLGYSRSQERDADEWGVRYHVDANYNPEGFVTFFEHLAEQPSPPAFISTHPDPAERIENVRRQIREKSDVPTRLERERFQQMRDRI